MNFRVVSASLALSLSACASFGTFAGQEGGEVEFAADAETNMRKGDDAMNAKNYTEAASFFEFVKTKYVYLDLAKTAELRLADADFERERFAEARDRYQNFVRLHPTHPRVDYAAFRAALTHYKEIPSDFFLLPPASEKDQVEVRNAASAMTDCEVMRLEKTAIVRVLHEEPAFADMFVTHLLARTIRVEEDLVDQLFNSSEKRLARTLLLLANFGKEGKPEPVIAKISQETLAEMIGTTRSRVSHFMNKFRKLGFIEYNGVLKINNSLLSVVLRD